MWLGRYRAPGMGPGNPQRDVHSLGARATEAHQLGTGDDLLQLLRELDLALVLPGVELAYRRSLAHRTQHLWMAMPQDQRPLSQNIVDVLVAIYIPHPAALCAAEEQRVRESP